MEKVDEEEVQEEVLPELRSMDCDIESTVIFKPSCDRRVDLFWLDYRGQRVKYATLEKDLDFHISTFVSHPWLLRDADTGLVLTGNGQTVFMPTENENLEEPLIVTIGIPVYRLVDRCMEVFAQMVGDGKVNDLDVPVCLKMDLLTHIMNKKIPFDVYDCAEV